MGNNQAAKWIGGRRPSSSRQESAPATGHFPIVGVGASAGGLEAFTRLLKHLPVDTGMGFVLVQHLDPQHESALAQILSRATTIPVREVVNGMPVLPNHVHIIPPNTCMYIEGRILKLKPRQEQSRTPHHSIDMFFESLAEDQHECAIGVVLSGTGTDGTLGLKAIKEAGGITFAQDGTAGYDAMPRNAVAADCVDFVLSPEKMTEELARIARHPYVADAARSLLFRNLAEEEAQAPETDAGGAGATERRKRPQTGSKAGAPEEDEFRKILVLLHNQSGVDFSLYKPNTIHRRIARRVVLNRLDTLQDYGNYLRGNGKELEALFSDVLINVTSFFRNPEVFETLKHKVFPKLIIPRRKDPVRLWVPGCSTGEEAYSLAICFFEFSESIAVPPKLQIFASDLNETALEQARQGLYSKVVAQSLSPERLRRFFVEEPGGYRINKAAREAVVFARQNLLSDPPFSRMDGVSCRNLLIYIDSELQRKILPTFHYSLKPGGFLLLGASESISSFGDLFESIDKKQKIYSKKPVPTPMTRMHFAPAHPAVKMGVTAKPSHEPQSEGATQLDAQREANRVLAAQFAPPGVLINAALQILHFRGATRPYLEPSAGNANFDLLKMAREGLMLPLRSVVNKARKENKTVRSEAVRLSENGVERTINLEVIPLKNLKEPYYLVLFKPVPEPGQGPLQPLRAEMVKEIPPVGSERSRLAAALRRQAEAERELIETREYLQTVQEQQEAANEELQAANEEVQSANEELQSINEELETSKEELESSNEELTTINDEMASRNVELNRVNNDLSNFHVSINTAILLLGRDLTIRRFTPLTEKAFNLLRSDLGRPLSGIRHNLDLPDLEKLLIEVIDTVSVREREVRDKQGHWYLLRARPYLTLDNKVDGAVLMLIDIDDMKRARDDIAAAREYAESILKIVPPLLILDHDLRVVSANESFYKHFHLAPAGTEKRLVYELDQGQWNIPRLRKLLDDVLPRNSFFEGFEVTHEFTDLGRRTLHFSGQRVDHIERILLSIDDVSERLQLQTDLRHSEVRYRRLFEAAKDGILILDPETRKITEANPFISEFLGYPREELVGKELWEIGLLKDKEASQQAFRQLKADAFIRYESLPLETKADRRCEVEFVSNLYQENGQKVIQCNIRDITERKGTERALRASEERFRVLFELGPVAIYYCDAAGVILEFNRHAVELWGREPQAGDTDERFCGSFRLFRPDGSFLPHGESPVAGVIAGTIPAARDQEVIIERPDGSRFTVIVNIRPVMNEQGKISGAINCFYDITERKRAEEALREAGERFRFLAESMPQKIFTATADGEVDYFNREWMEFTGLSFEQIRGWGWKQFMHPDEVEETVSHWKKCVASGEYFQMEHRFRRHDGVYHWHLSRAHALRDAAGKVLMWTGSNTDIEDQKQRAGVLEEQVSARTSDLRSTTSQLETFVYSVAHDLRGPLRAMEGFAQMLAIDYAPHLDAEGQAHAAHIIKSAQFMDNLLRDLLAFAQISQQKIELAPVNLETVVQGACHGCQKEIRDGKAQVEYIAPWPAVRAHAATLGQVLTNLLANAIKFVAPGVQPRVSIRAEELSQSVLVWVEDNGIGIAPESQERIFNVFQRLHTTEYAGTGIGLAIVKKGMERMGGRAGVESAPGKGSRFWVELARA